MTDKESKWIKFYPSLELPKERVSIAYATHDERGYRFAYGYFQFYNGTCGCFWKDGNEQPKVVKAEDIKYWMPVPSLDVQEEPVSEDLEEAAEVDFIGRCESHIFGMDFHKPDMISAFKAGAKWKKENMMAKAFDAEVLENYDGKCIEYDETILDEKLSDCNVFDKVKVIIVKDET